MRPRFHGFTLIELLVVISIIALLISILLPVLGSARNQAKMARELAASRQLGQAYIGYALDQRGKTLPGYLQSASVPATDGTGATFSGEPAKRYPWRLMAYINHSVFGSLLVNEQADSLADRSQNMWRYMVSVFPSFGMNYYYIGGEFNPDQPESAWPAYQKYFIRRVEDAVQPSRMILFSSAYVDDGLGGYTRGFFRITAPKGPTSAWAAVYGLGASAGDTGNVDPRWGGRAILAHLDGHSEMLGVEQMRDMTRWSNQAAGARDSDWTPTY